MTTKNLTAAAILAACKPPRETVQALGGKITLQGAAYNRDAFEALLHGNPGNDGGPDLSKLRLFMVSACIVSKDGKRLFTSAKEIEQLGQMPREDFDKLAEVSARLLAVNSGTEEAKND